MKIAYLGPAASFTHSAAKSAFRGASLIPTASIPECIMAIQNNEVDAAVVPVENTIEGGVNITLDYLFHFSDVPIQAELVLPIAQHVMVHKTNAASWQSVQKIMSHPQGLAQCETFLKEELYGAVREATPSTAYAAKWVSEHESELVAAIAPRMAAEEYGLQIVKENAQDIELNQTRFVVLSRKKVSIPLKKEEEKTSVSVLLPNNIPGALHKILSTFAWRNIDMSKIESRPLKTALGEYFFLIDLLSENKAELIQNALEEIRLLGGKANVLGIYNVYRILN